jgi:hypothetical protein
VVVGAENLKVIKLCVAVIAVDVVYVHDYVVSAEFTPMPISRDCLVPIRRNLS